MKDRSIEESSVHAHRLKIDPGSLITGFAVVNERKGRVVFAAELTHRGQQIRDDLISRALRRGRRSRHTRYRLKRFNNRRREPGWLPPSLSSRVDNIMTWVQRISMFCPIDSLSQQLVRFDTQALVNPEISGAEYQQGELSGYEIREYLLQKWGRKCAYCEAVSIPLEIEHIQPKSKGGSDRVSNLTLACHDCNQKKGNQALQDFLKGKPDLVKQILSQAKAPLKDAAALNATRWKLLNRLEETGLSVETGTGGRTKFNRVARNIDKTHWTDATCVGASTPKKLLILGVRPLLIRASGHGNRQMCGTNKYGFPTRYRSNVKKHFGFQTGDMVRAIVTSGKKIGPYVGRVLCRKSGSFDISTSNGRVTGINHRCCKGVHCSDGYTYS